MIPVTRWGGTVAGLLPQMLFGLLVMATTARGSGGEQHTQALQAHGLRGAGSQLAVPDWLNAVPFFDNVYHVIFGPLLLLTIALAWMTRPKVDVGETVPADFWKHQCRYLSVWGLAVAADWLQGPYVYALYASYGYSPAEIAQLFVAGFGASLVFGTFVGNIADTWGRKLCAILYCVLYAASCCTKHSKIFWILMVGRVTGGIATSLLFSTFECWLVAEHLHKRRFSDSLLKYMFGLMYGLQYLVAIVAGVVAQAGASAWPLAPCLGGVMGLHCGGYTVPFDISAVVLVITIPVIAFSWEENYGAVGPAATSVQQIFETFASTCRAFGSSWGIIALCCVVSTFEGSMYAFVFNWTPALNSKASPPPHGLIFSAFMMACMCGSSVFAMLGNSIRPVKVLLYTCISAALSLGMVMMWVGQETWNPLIFCCFLVFEACVGIYFPAMGSVKSEVVPEDVRAGIYNIYRVPLNGIVVGILLSNVTLRLSFGLCCTLLAVASGVLACHVLKEPEGKSNASTVKRTM